MRPAFVMGKAVVAVVLLISTLIITAGAVAAAPVARMDYIRLNQLGYYPESRKVAVVVEDGSNNYAPTEFLVVGVPGNQTVFRGRLSDVMEWAESGEKGRRADFSQVRAPGRYKLVILGNVPAGSESHVFEISGNVYGNAANASMRAFYFQRCSAPLSRALVGVWGRNTGHPDTEVSFHPSTGKWAGDGKLRSPGGWYDAGDFGKYIVNSGITVGTLLAFYENFPEYFPDRSLRIPESGNGRPDILDEVKVNLDWMRTMQDADGGVFFKLSTLEFPGYVLPQDDRGERFAIGKSTTSALNFAAAMAMAGRVYVSFDSAYAKSCVEMAARAWDWAVKNPGVAFRNPPDVRTGEYRDVKFDDEFTWAAAELFITTGDRKYADFLKNRDLTYKSEPSWQNVHGLAPLSLVAVKNGLDAQTLDAVRKSIVAAADRWLGEMDRHLYRVPQTNFIWGSNSIFANRGIAMIYAHKITGDRKYLLGAAEIADYLLGKNAVGLSFVTAFGTKFAANPHHRHVVAAMGLERGVDPERRRTARSGADIVIPGFLVGGPNAGHQDSVHGVTYVHALPAKSYEDVYKSYASNEVAINWNAPSTFLLGAVDALMAPKPEPPAAPAEQQPRQRQQPVQQQQPVPEPQQRPPAQPAQQGD